jgi:hypothetical protein
MASSTPSALRRTKKAVTVPGSNMFAKTASRKGKSPDSDDGKPEVKKQGPVALPTYDCGGAIHIKFSLKRNAVNVVYKHNPIHTTREADNGYVLPFATTENGYVP